MRTATEALRPLVALLTMFLVITFWVLKSPNDIINADPRMVYVLVGTLFSNLTCRLIVSQMSGQRCELICWLLWPLSAVVLFCLFVPKIEMLALLIITLFSIYAHIHYGTCVVRQMCDHFRLGCFYIKQQSD